MKDNLKIVLVCMLIIVSFGFLTQKYSPNQIQIKKLRAEIEDLQSQLCIAQDYIPSIEELQQRLVNQGYYIEIDGDVGSKKSKTRTAWNRYICAREGLKAMNKVIGE